MNYETKFKIGEPVQIIEKQEVIIDKKITGIILEVGEETILIQWNDLQNPTEYDMNDFYLIQHEEKDTAEILFFKWWNPKRMILPFNPKIIEHSLYKEAFIAGLISQPFPSREKLVEIINEITSRGYDTTSIIQNDNLVKQLADAILNQSNNQ